MLNLKAFTNFISNIDGEAKVVLENVRDKFQSIILEGNTPMLMLAMKEVYNLACIPQIQAREVEEEELTAIISSLDRLEIAEISSTSMEERYTELMLAYELLCNQFRSSYLLILLGDGLVLNCYLAVKAYANALMSYFTTLATDMMNNAKKSNRKVNKDIASFKDILEDTMLNVGVDNMSMAQTIIKCETVKRLEKLDMDTALCLLYNQSLKFKRESDKNREKNLLVNN